MNRSTVRYLCKTEIKHTPRSNRNPIKPDDIPNLLREEKPRAQQHLAWKSSSDATLRKARRYVSDRRWTDDAVKGQRLWLPGVNLAHANHVGVHATSAAVSSICGIHTRQIPLS